MHEATRVTTGCYPATGSHSARGHLVSFDSRRPLSRPQNVETTMAETGIDSFAATIPDPATGRTLPAADRMEKLLAEVETADRVGLDVFGIGEHHRKEFLDSAPPVILAAAAARTKRIRLTSAVSVLSAADPVRLFQEFATVDLIA